MLLKRFAVKGFKNLTREIALENLGLINVFHGENSVGKSNLLQAISLFFECLRTPQQLQSSRAWFVGSNPLVSSPNLFNLEYPAPINLEATLSLSEEELIRLQKIYPQTPPQSRDIELAFRLELDTSVRCVFTRLRQGGETFPETQPLPDWLFLAIPNNLYPNQKVRSMELVGLQRATEVESRQGTNSTLALEMFDARDSLEIVRATRWKTFVEVMRRFESVTGPGEFVVTYQRQQQKALLLFDDGRKRIPFELMGSGVQQLVALLGNLLLNSASIVAIEEPELNLRYTVQGLLREALRDLIGKPEAPAQLFVTSHSPAFESGDTFYAMRPSTNGPEVQQLPTSEAHRFTSHTAEFPPDRSAHLSYVTSEGLVKLPDFVREGLQVTRGGGVVFHVPEHRRHAEMRRTEQFLAELYGETPNATESK